MSWYRKFGVEILAVAAVTACVSVAGTLISSSSVGLPLYVVGYVITAPGLTVVEQLIDCWWWLGWWKLVAAAIIATVYWSVLAIGLMSFARRRFVVSVGLLLAASCATYTIGFRTNCFSHGDGTTCLHRSWGAITRTTSHGGSLGYDFRYKWIDPHCGNHSGTVTHARWDFNGDGRWDTWMDPAERTLAIDTTGNEEPDRVFGLDHDGWSQVRELRGY